MDAGQDVFGVQAVATCHLGDPLGAEGVFRIDVKDISIQSTLFNRKRAVHSELMPNLCLSTPEFTVDLHERLGLEAATEQVVDGLDFRAKLLDFTTSLEKRITRNESPNVGHFLSRSDDLC